MREVAESQSAAILAIERRVRLLEARVETLAEAVEMLARGFEVSPMAEPEDFRPEEAVRRARELLLLAKPARGDGRAGDSRVPS
jgi:hypothetical protein